MIVILNHQNAELKFNFGGEPFKNAPKDDFKALDQAPDGHVVKTTQTGELFHFAILG